MYERYAMSRNDDLGYIMLHEAIRLGESLGLVNTQGPRISSAHLSPDMDASFRRTAWGLFNIDTYVYPRSIARWFCHRLHVSMTVWFTPVFCAPVS